MQEAEDALLREHAMLIHGQMTSEQKHLVLKTFKEGRCRLLISTVVIEVGIDVPDATLMVVEHAERFGLLQLHQLRGRVGRSTKQSACVLVTAAQQALERLQVLEVRPFPHACIVSTLHAALASVHGHAPRLSQPRAQSTNNGHEVALEDMRLRGAGQLFGQRQSGPANTGLGALLSMTDLSSDEDTLLIARNVAAEMVAEHGFVGLPRGVLAAAAAYRMTSLLAMRMQDIDIHM